MFPTLLERFLRYVKMNTRSDSSSTAIPTTQGQVELAKLLLSELEELGLEEIQYHTENGFVTATLPGNTNKEVPVIGFIAHLDTADFEAEGVSPQLVPSYDGGDIPLDKEGQYILSPKEFPNLKNYIGETLVTTDGSTLLGADDKAGIAEIMAAVEYLVTHPEVPHGTIKVAFGPDEEIGTGADRFVVEDFAADFAYTMDGGPVGDLNYETFNAASAKVTIQGRNVHPGTAKGIMINAIKLGMDFNSRLPQQEAPEHTTGYEGFYHLNKFSGTEECTKLSYIVRDHDRTLFEERKKQMLAIADEMNATLDQPRIQVELADSYYNMGEVIAEKMEIVDLAIDAMKNLDITPMIRPIRGGTDGSKLSLMGLPTPNLFTGGENFHGRFEFASKEGMELAAQTILEISRLNVERNQ